MAALWRRWACYLQGATCSMRFGPNSPSNRRRPTPISPPLVKRPDLLRPVVERRRRATARNNADSPAFSFSAVFVSSAGFHLDDGMDPTPIEAQASRSEARGSSDPRGLETHSGPRIGLLMTSDVARARPVSPGSGEGQRQLRTRSVSEESGRPVKRARYRTCGS
jgi:hypothetical protein